MRRPSRNLAWLARGLIALAGMLTLPGCCSEPCGLNRWRAERLSHRQAAACDAVSPPCAGLGCDTQPGGLPLQAVPAPLPQRHVTPRPEQAAPPPPPPEPPSAGAFAPRRQAGAPAADPPRALVPWLLQRWDERTVRVAAARQQRAALRASAAWNGASAAAPIERPLPQQWPADAPRAVSFESPPPVWLGAPEFDDPEFAHPLPPGFGHSVLPAAAGRSGASFVLP